MVAISSNGSRFTRRTVLAGLGAVAMAPLIEACGQAAAPSSAPPASGAGALVATSQAAQPAAAAVSQAPVTIRVMDRLALSYVDFANTWIDQYHQKQSKIKVQFEPRPADWTEKLTAAMAAGAAPDVMAIFGEWYRTFQQKGQVIALDNYIKSSFSDADLVDYWKGQWNGMNYQGKQLGVPYYINVNAMYYDTGALQEAGLAKPDNNWTIDQFHTYTQKLTKRTGDTIDHYGLVVDYPQYFRRLISFVWAQCGQVNDPSDIRKFTFTNPQTVSSVQWTHDLAWVDKVAWVTSSLIGGIDPAPAFWGGKAAMLFEGISIFEAIPEGLTFKWDVAPPPVGSCGRGQRTAMDGFAIYAKSKNPDQSWTVLNDMVSPATMRMRQDMVGLVASRKSVGNDWPKTRPDLNLQSIVDTLNDAQPDPLSLWDRSAEVWNGIKGINDQMMIQNTLPVPDGLAQMQTTVEKIYQG